MGGGRVFNELQIILKEADPLPAVFRLAELGLLKYIHPTLSAGERTRALFTAAGRAMSWYELLYTGESSQRWQVYFLCLTGDLDRDAMTGICRRLGIPSRYRRIFCDEREEAHTTLNRLERRRSRKAPQPSELYHRLSPFSTETLLYIMARAASEEVRRWVSLFVTRLRSAKTILSGHDLRQLGIPPGPRYKKILTELLDARLNGSVTTREDEVAFVRAKFLKK